MNGEQQSAAQAADLLMEHGVEARDRITFRADTAQAAAEAVAYLARHLNRLPGSVRKSLKRSRNSAALLSGDRLQGLSEMIQNADDAGATQVRVALLPDGMWVAHDGEPLQLEHVFGIAMPWITTKDQDADATGRHGIGLMTLRALSLSLQVHCPPYHVQLDDDALAPVDAMVAPGWLAGERWTVMRVPLATNTVSRQSLHEWFTKWGHAGLLFLKSVVRVSLHDEAGAAIDELHLKWEDADGFKWIVAEGEEFDVEVSDATDPQGNAHRVYKAQVASPADIDRYGKAKAERTPIAIALPLYRSEDYWLHAGLPVVKTKVRARIAAQFDTLSNRQGLAPTDWNRWLLPAIGKLWLASVEDMFERDTKFAWPLVPLEPPEEDKGSSIETDLEHEIWALAGGPLAICTRVPAAGGEMIAITNVAVEEPQLDPVLDEDEVAALGDAQFALPRALRDAEHRWWHVLDLWRQHSDEMPKPVDTKQALVLLDDPVFPVERRIALSAVAIEERLGPALATRPCIALADGRTVAPPAIDGPEMLVLNAGTLAEALGVGLHVHPRYQDDTPAARAIMTWLRARNVLMESKDALALLKRIAQAGTGGKQIGKPLTDEQLASLRDAFESVSPDEQGSLGPAVGRAVRLEAFRYDDKRALVVTVCSPAQAYLPARIDRDADGFAVAAGKTPGLYWMSNRYATALRSTIGRAGLGAQRFLGLLGAERAPRVFRHRGLFDRYASDRRKGLPASTGPESRTAAMQAVDAEFTLEDSESPDLQRVVLDIAAEKKHTQRRERAAALLATLGRAWEHRLADQATVTAAATGGSWHSRGDFRAYWLWAAGNIEWLDDSTGTKRRPCDLRLRTPASVAIYGARGSNYLRPDLQAAARPQLLEALGVEGEASTGELIRHLRKLREHAGENVDAKLETETAVVYQALATRFAGGRSAGDMTSRRLQIEFSDVKGGLILSGRRWRRPGEVLLGPPSFGSYRDYIPAVPHTENLWKALQIREAGIDDCIEVMKDVAVRRKILEGEEVAVMVATLRMLQERITAGRLDATLTGRLRRAPLWTTLGWERERPVYAVSEPAIAQALADHIPVWKPGCEISNVSACLEPLGVKVVTAADSRIVDGHQAETDEATTLRFQRAVSHLHEDLSRNEPQIAAALLIPWDRLKRFQVKVQPDLRVRLVSVIGWSESDLIAVRAKADAEGEAMHVREVAEWRRVESGGRAVAALFKADPRKVAHAWLAACEKAEDGIAAEEIIAAEEAAKLEAERLEQKMNERARQMQAELANRKVAKAGKPAKPAATPAPRALEPAPSPQLKPRVLVDPRKLQLKNPRGEVVAKAQPPASSEGRPPAPLPAPRSSSSPSRDSKSLPTFSGKTKETLGMELVERALQYDEGEWRDLRSQMRLGADAVDEESRFYELKVFSGGEPNTIHMTESEVLRAQSTDKFYLVIVSNLEGETAKPFIRIITDPLKQLKPAGSGGISLTNVKYAASLVFDYEHGPDGDAVASAYERDSDVG
ncbi:MAG TPA: hypothetical protein VF169_15125 [Albitalea sp.]|uniref:sacsin N-terminal ATP-binding-like domain-containing protein n=1 Tax=Piscinibacter sp. TaxID=1903157 RepID=UPI002ED2B5AE